MGSDNQHETVDQTDTAVQAMDDQAPQVVPLIAIGASAGGLEPLEEFFDTAPEGAGWSFIVVQHLSPDYRSIMDELLSRRTRLKIRHVEEGAKIEPDTIYLNLPNTVCEVENETFSITPYSDADTLPHLPIDALFTSLCARPARLTAAVILSGAGADGSRGAKRLYDEGAAVLVQTPGDAMFASMPRAVLATGAVDRVVAPREMPDEIAGFFRQGKLGSYMEGVRLENDAIQSIFNILERKYNIDFSAYKALNLVRRIERRQNLRGLATLEEYRALLASDSAALDELYHDLLIGVTEFYRDPDSITVLRKHALSELVRKDTGDAPLRIWVPACATGEEAYTIAIELSEELRNAGVERNFRIIATDVHPRSIEVASAGVYSASAMEKVPASIRNLYFTKINDKYVVNAALRQKLIFSIHDALSDPPFMYLDLVSCRNLMIYLKEEAQARMVSMFLFGLRRDGFLLLGPSESLGKFSEEFSVVNGRWRLFKKNSSKRIVDRSLLSSRPPSMNWIDTRGHGEPLTPVPVVEKRPAEFTIRRDREVMIKSYDALLRRYAPSSIMVTSEGEVMSWFGGAAPYVDTLNNLADWTVENIVHPDLHFTINVAMERLRQGQLDSYSRAVNVDMGDGHVVALNVKVEALDSVGKPRFMLVSLSPTRPEDLPDDVKAIPPDSGEDASLLSRRIQELERDLRLTEETLQHVTERLEASGEELQASNEELQASNEELQASNEELQSSNEELHAVNEELVSLGAQHERKIELLSELNRDTEMILNILGTGVIVLDSDLRIRRFSDRAGKAFQLESHDIDRRLSVVGPHPDFVDLTRAATEVIETGKEMRVSGEYEGAQLTIQLCPFGPETIAHALSGVLLMFTIEDAPES